MGGLKVGELYAELRLDSNRFTGPLGRAGAGIRSLVGRVVKAGAVMGAALIALAVDAGKHAADQEKSLNQVTKVFGKAAAGVVEFAQSAAFAFGIEDDAALSAMATFGLLLRNFGFTKKAAAGMSETLLAAASDLASFKNIPVAQAISAITKGLAGQTRGLKSLGIVIDSTSVKERALSLGLGDAKGKLTAHDLAIARYQLLLERVAVATGDFKDRQASLGNQLRISGALWDNFLDTVGAAVLPIAVFILPKFNRALNDITTAVGPFATTVGGLFETLSTGGVRDFRREVDRLASAGDFIGEVLQAIIEKGEMVGRVLDVAGGLIEDAWGKLKPTLQPAIDLFGKYSSAAQVLAGIIVAAFLPALWGLASAVAAVALPVLAVMGVVALLRAAWDSDFGGIQERVAEWSVVVQGIVNDVVPALQSAFDTLTNDVLPALAGVFEWFTRDILPAFQSVFDTISTVWVPFFQEVLQGLTDWFRDNWPGISELVGHLGDVFKGIADIIAWVFAFVSPLLVEWVKGFGDIGAGATILLDGINKVFRDLGAAWDNIGKRVSATADAIGYAWKLVKDVFKRVWDGIVAGAKGGVNILIGIINGVIRAIDAIKIGPVDILGVHFEGWGGLKIPLIPYLAKGTKNWPGGWAMLGEQGPELARLPGGTRVYPARETAAMMGGGGGGTVRVDVRVSGGMMTPGAARELAHTLGPAIAKELQRGGLLPQMGTAQSG